MALGAIRRAARRAALVVLQTLMGLAAVGGGLDLALNDGRLIGMPADLLRGSPFSSFLIPGVVLLAVGLVNLAGASAAWRRLRWAAAAAAVSGLLWVGWFVVQVAVVGFVSWQQPVYLAIGVVIIALASASLVGRIREETPLARRPGSA